MPSETPGYAYLTQHHRLPALAPRQFAVIDTAFKGQRAVLRGDRTELQFEPKYRPDPTLAGHLQFALRYEGVDLQVLGLLFEVTGPEPVEAWIREQPASMYARRAAFLFEWLTGGSIAAEATPKSRFVEALDPRLQFDYASGERNAKFRVIDNLPGTRAFCPLVHKTKYLLDMQSKRLADRAAETLARHDPELVRRAAAFLYLSETKSSFEVERERPSQIRAQRFTDLLREAGADIAVSEDRLVELQNAIVDQRFREAGYRSMQNWLGDDLGYRKRVEFVPPRPDDVDSLMQGLVAFAARQRRAPNAMDAVVAAASIAFGFVFIHPFIDGNGRLHRYLVHDALTVGGFTPPGVILPVSAAILADLRSYVDTLRRFSQPLLERTEYEPDAPKAATGNDAVYFRYFDATPQAEYLYAALERTIEHALKDELEFLVAFDRAMPALNALLDWPPHNADLFIRVVRQNDGKLSATKRASHFAWMTDAEVVQAEVVVRKAFSSGRQTGADLRSDASPRDSMLGDPPETA